MDKQITKLIQPHWKQKKDMHIFFYQGGCTSSDQSASSAACVLQGWTAPEDRSADRSTAAAFWVQWAAALVTRHWTLSQPGERKVPGTSARHASTAGATPKTTECLIVFDLWVTQLSSAEFSVPPEDGAGLSDCHAFNVAEMKGHKRQQWLVLSPGSPLLGRHRRFQWWTVNCVSRPSETLYLVWKSPIMSRLSLKNSDFRKVNNTG